MQCEEQRQEEGDIHTLHLHPLLHHHHLLSRHTENFKEIKGEYPFEDDIYSRLCVKVKILEMQCTNRKQSLQSESQENPLPGPHRDKHSYCQKTESLCLGKALYNSPL